MKRYDTIQLKPQCHKPFGKLSRPRIIMTNKTAKPTAKIEGLYTYR